MGLWVHGFQSSLGSVGFRDSRLRASGQSGASGLWVFIRIREVSHFNWRWHSVESLSKTLTLEVQGWFDIGDMRRALLIRMGFRGAYVCIGGKPKE